MTQPDSLASPNTYLSYMRTVGFPPVPVLSLSTFVDFIKDSRIRQEQFYPTKALYFFIVFSSSLCETELLVASSKPRRKINSISPLSMKRPLGNSKPIPGPYQAPHSSLLFSSSMYFLCFFSHNCYNFVNRRHRSLLNTVR